MFPNSHNPSRAAATFTVLSEYHKTMFFIHPSLAIYDYFAFLYFTSIALSIYNIINKKFILLSIIISTIVVHDTSSRLFIYGIYLIPIVLAIYFITKLTYFYIIISLIIAITLYVGLNTIDMTNVETSLASRYIKWNNFEFIQLLIPYTNEYRMNY